MSVQLATDSPFMTVDECAIYLRMTRPGSAQTLYRWARTGQIPARKINGMLRFYRPEIDQWSASKLAAPMEPSLTPFERARLRARSLKTEHTAKGRLRVLKGNRVDGN